MEAALDTAAFQRRLRETGAYRTPEGRARPALGRFDCWFYWKLLGIVYDGYRAAKRGDYDAKYWAAHSYRAFRLLEDCGATITVEGLRHAVELGRPAVYVGNHMSLIEALILPAILAHVDPFVSVVKASLLDYPLFGTFIKTLDPIRVTRRDPREDLKAVLDQGTAVLARGRSVCLFPQSTRSAAFDPGTFNSLGAKLARSAGVPVLPIALRTDFIANGRLLKDIGPLDRGRAIRFKFGAPVLVEGNGREAHQRVVRFIGESLAAWAA